MTKLKLLSSLFSFLATLPAHASVDIREGTYATSVVDLDLTRAHDSLRLRRLYRSRGASVDGPLGFGWCLDFDAKLRRSPDGTLALSECGASDEIRYRRQGASPKWRAENRAEDSLVSAPDLFLRLAPNGTLQKFDALSGRLVGITDRAGRVLRLGYDDDGRLIAVRAQSGESWRLAYDHDHLERVVAADATSTPIAVVHFTYTPHSELAGARSSMSAASSLYRYDGSHRLIQSNPAGGVSEHVSYDTRLGRVTSVAPAEGCAQNFTYEDHGNHLIADAVLACGKTRLTRKHYDFWYSPGADRYLERMRVSGSDETLEITFHPVSGQPLTIQRLTESSRLAASTGRSQ